MQYSNMAEYYDRIMDHVDYVSWANYISSIFICLKLDVKSILETACGTGNLSLEFQKLGYSVTATDLSPQMLYFAAKKNKTNLYPVKLFASNMTALPLKARYDAVVCIYDSMNYLMNEVDFIKALNDIYAATKKGGVFVFDVCTFKNSESYFMNHKMVEEFGEIQCLRTCRFTPHTGIQENHFTFENTRDGKTFSESHFQRIYRVHEIQEMIKRSQFQEKYVFDDLTFFEGSEDSERIHFVLQKV